jgi:hypothetical protein
VCFLLFGLDFDHCFFMMVFSVGLACGNFVVYIYIFYFPESFREMIECVCCKNSLTFTIYSGSDRADQNILHSDVVIATAVLLFVFVCLFLF